MRPTRALFIAAWICFVSGVADARDPAVADFLAEHEIPAANASAVVVCHGFGCKYRTSVSLTETDFKALRRILDKGKKSASAELNAIAEAVAWFERRIGPITGTSRRTPRAGPDQAGLRSEADCIDETINTTQLLLLLSELRLLRHHAVVGPESRGYIFDGRYPHATAVVAELQSGRRWAVDPWPRRNGERPDTLPIERWLKGG
jgi:hypothetical protein